MEVSVIGNPQARICRVELAERVNRFCIGSEFISINARTQVSINGTSYVPGLPSQQLDFTAMVTMIDEYQSPKSLSSPESLLAHIKTCCKKHGVVVSGQNSSEPNLGGFERITENLKDENAAINLFTYQRMGALFFSPDHFHAFTEFVRKLNQFKLPEDDL
ncbi:Glycoside hydrolase family 14 [Arabidopsis suecica]|uniref:Glycoside hydrolase family 14 n=1 Tax=Arabidopsis suecica TaxID=45249 RepID=A0A8T2B4P1_ARASU|nr:Glycoside hydrolase family 14 [Arabidopsis suecica]